ncbi:hypothetical protein B0H14DRAFT_3028567 [Mycena olivaceomarginata]|nr:hypothetical protein B0H14DRAFT_3028567 [Mycena olivaceomarginata]
MMETVPTISSLLTTLAERDKRVNFNGYFSIAPKRPAVTTRRQPKIELSHLALLISQIMSHWLLALAGAFAISHLRSVETECSHLMKRYLDLGTLPALRLLDVCTEPSQTRLMHALLRPPAHLTLEIITIRIDIPIYTDEYAYSFDIFTEDAAALVALHPIRRLAVHYVETMTKKESMRSFSQQILCNDILRF